MAGWRVEGADVAVTTDILAAYRRPRAVLRRQLQGGEREDRALIYLMLACLLIFVGQWPALQRAALADPDTPLDARVGGALMAWLFVAPLAMYALAGLSHLIARLLGGRGTGFGARLALFWSLLVAAPLWLFYGLVAGLIGPGPALSATGVVAFGAFVVLWLAALFEAEWGPTT
jgi:hypothetical protein